MGPLLRSFVDEVASTTPWEASAAVLALAYLVLAVRRSLWCWPCAFVSSLLYLAVMARAGLYMQAALQAFYVVMAVYGYLAWRRGRGDDGEIAIERWPLRAHAVAVIGVVVVSAVSAAVLSLLPAARSPFLDAFVTWGSVLSTVMVARRLVENWLYWFVVDGAAAWVYFHEGLAATGLLFVIYVVVVVRGYVVWRREHRAVRHA